MGTFYIADGNSFAYRAFFGMPPLTTADGMEVHAVYGFYNMLLRIIKDKKPDCFCIAFDYPGKTYRNEMFPGYKEKRQKMPDSLKIQMKLIKEIASAGKIPLLEEEGYEADDLIASAAHDAEKKKMKVTVLTGDKDLIQIVNKNISILRIGRDGETILTPESVKLKMGIEPHQIIDVLSLMGDSADNIPGVKGIGEKTAYALVKEYDSIDGIIKNAEKIKPERAKKLILAGIEELKISRQLITLNTDKTPLEKINFKSEECTVSSMDTAALDREFIKYNFKSLVSGGQVKQEVKAQKKSVNISSFDEIKKELSAADTISVFFGGEESVEIAAVSDGKKYWHMFGSSYSSLPGFLKGKKIITNSAKRIFSDSALDDKENIFDVMLASYLVDPERNFKDAAGVFSEYLGGTFLSFDELAGKGAKKIMIELAEKENIDKYVFSLCAHAEDLAFELGKKMKKASLSAMYSGIELPLSRVLAVMEKEGLKIDRKFLQQLIKDTEKEIAASEKTVYKLTGEEFNINSPKQLSVILFEKLKLKTQKKTKTGFSTDVEVLSNLEDAHPAVAEILKYRSLTKLKGGFLDVILSYMTRDDRIFPSYNQTVAATGRLSSSNPNIQNIPVRSEEAKAIRKIFIPLGAGETVLKADYSQIELRIMAHVSGDKKLIDAFKKGEDIHTITGCEVFEVSKEKLTHEQRRFAKTINFGIIYGMSPYGLAKQLKISNYEAAEYIDKFFANFPGVKKYQQDTIASARENGYVETLMGRRRYFRDINSANRTVRELSERAAINAPIQGTAADIIKKAMIDIQGELENKKMKTKMILQVHDELVFSVPEKETAAARAMAVKLMEGSADLKVPVTVTVGTGENWFECG